MRALVCGSIGPFADALRVKKVADPEPGPDEVLIKVESCGIAFPDVLMMEGKHISKKTAPYTPGSDVCGTVVQLGEDVTSLKLGQRVFGNAISVTDTAGEGGCAELCRVIADQVYPVPSGVSPHVCAGFEFNYGTTWHAFVDIARVQPGETILVLGASGGIGMSAIDIGKSLGCTVIACCSTEDKLEAARKQGADVLINYSKDLKAELKAQKLYGRIDVVYDPVGGSVSEVALRALGWRGRLLVCGFAAGGANPKAAIPSVPLNLALLNERAILGVFWGAWRARDRDVGHRKHMQKMLELLQKGELNPTISQVYTLEQAIDACADLMGRRVIAKVCISPTGARL